MNIGVNNEIKILQKEVSSLKMNINLRFNELKLNDLKKYS